MSLIERPDGKFDFVPPDPKQIKIPKDYIVKAGDELLELCQMCKKSRLTCDNEVIREVKVPLEADDDPALGVITYVRQNDGTYVKFSLSFKIVDGVIAGIYKSEEDIPIPFVCAWFEPKTE